MIPKESRNELALDTFIKAHPELLEEMKELSAEDRQQQILWAFENEADDLGIEAWELALQLIARSPEELAAMRLEVHQEVAEALEMSWEEYCGLNDIAV
ncbi:hypothetical protein SAMN04490203_1369 [Pseudomonas taetrolens]|uniref:Dephospho-CoA kinase n=1 Tax=Pseudomonas taetrolens TaxID=47884 RepID=A0A0J6GN10_PSETA|nr:DUF6388 family protein [Pseudomonas taetrolens]KMM83733.1 hypothetical protein TU78_14735 [Pseudomonas taetrolens]SEB88257.1 hypothetical protein SAMN04490203_1369 [Pseudomonas taetrolens]SQF85537.1 DNA repair ATPase [Pseudomonas taetrolens]VEH48580.1 DNA repair ATPase [Pseudomonas taetrolens]